MHAIEKKGTHLGWQMDLQISSLQDKRRKCIMQSEEKRKFLCVTRIKTASYLRGLLTIFSSFCLESLPLSFFQTEPKYVDLSFPALFDILGPLSCPLGLTPCLVRLRGGGVTGTLRIHT